MQRTLLTLALIATAGVSYAQQPMPSGEPTDPYGRPLIGRNDWVRQPGDQARSVRGGRRPCDERQHGHGAADADGSAGPAMAPQMASPQMDADAGPDRPASGHVQGRIRLPL